MQLNIHSHVQLVTWSYVFLSQNILKKWDEMFIFVTGSLLWILGNWNMIPISKYVLCSVSCSDFTWYTCPNSICPTGFPGVDFI